MKEINHKGIMTTKKTTTRKTTKRTSAKSPVKVNKSVCDMSPRECLAANKLLKKHVIIITTLSYVACALVVALMLVIANQ